MERLTKREGKHTIKIGSEWKRDYPVWERLAAYEDTGLTPAEVATLRTELEQAKWERDAAIGDLTILQGRNGLCRTCKSFTMGGCTYPNNKCDWQWRGVQEAANEKAAQD